MQDIKFNAIKEFAKEMKGLYKDDSGAMVFIDFIKELDKMKIEEVKEEEKETSINIGELARKHRKI